MRRIFSVILFGITLSSLVPFASAQEYTQCSQLAGNWQRVCNRIEEALDSANAKKDIALVARLNNKRLSLLNRYSRVVDRSLVDNTRNLRDAFKTTFVVVIGTSSKPLCDGSLAIVSRTLDKTTCRFSR